MGKQIIELTTLCLQYIHFKGILFVVFPRKLFPVDEINICHPRWKATRNYNITKFPLAVKKSVMSTAAAAVDIFAKKGIQGL